MTRRSRRPLFLFCSVLLAAAMSSLSAAFPDHTGYVTDEASVLDGGAEAALLGTLRDVEARTTAEIVVATVPSLDGMTVEDYGNRLFWQWGIGKRGKDNGVLILVAPGERKIRIEVGYGLEPVLPDGLSGEIIRSEALPAFRSGDIPGGITAAVNRVATIVLANHTLSAAERTALDNSADDRPPALLTTGFFSFFIAIGALSAGVGVRTKSIFPLIWGGLFGGIPLMMALIPFFNASLWVVVPLAMATFAFGWVKGGTERWRNITRGNEANGRKSKRGKQRGAAAGTNAASSSGWVMGSSSSSGSSRDSNGSSSSGSFGGGSSGGGGASGSW